MVRSSDSDAAHACNNGVGDIDPICIFVPYTRVKPATLETLWKYARLEHVPTSQGPLAKINFIDVCQQSGYLDYLQERWDTRRRFINVEHDVVAWPGAIEELWACEHEWCAHYYTLRESEAQGRNDAPPMGLAKFSPLFMQLTRDVWTTHRIKRAEWVKQYGNDPGLWAYLDLWLHDYATREGLKPHIHWPAVVNVKNNISLIPGPDGEPIEIIGEQ